MVYNEFTIVVQGNCVTIIILILIITAVARSHICSHVDDLALLLNLHETAPIRMVVVTSLRFLHRAAFRLQVLIV